MDENISFVRSEKFFLPKKSPLPSSASSWSCGPLNFFESLSVFLNFDGIYQSSWEVAIFHVLNSSMTPKISKSEVKGTFQRVLEEETQVFSPWKIHEPLLLIPL